jgi:hypothetical protein
MEDEVCVNGSLLKIATMKKAIQPPPEGRHGIARARTTQYKSKFQLHSL